MKLSEIIPEIIYNDIYDCGDETAMYVIDDTELSLFDDICEKIKERGYAESDKSIIDGNISRSFRKDCLIHVYFVPSEKRIRIITDGITCGFNTLPEKSGDIQPEVFQFEVDHSLIDCGMCYIMLCDDGSFIILDSPHWYSVNDDIRIIEFLKKISGEEKPRVSCWLFSHAHEDHIGKFNGILEHFYDKISIESVCFNFISPGYDRVIKESNVISGTEKFRSLLREHKEIKVIKPHTGMRLGIKNYTFTVLCTHEDIYPDMINDFNDTSTVFSAECCGTKIMLPGDASKISDRVLMERYSDALRCDIVQVSHHGHSGLSPEFYRRAGAKCALFPVTQIKFDEEFDRQESNRAAIEIADEYYIASNGTAEIPLPYSPGNVILRPDETFEDFDGIFNLWTYEYTEEYKNKLREQFEVNRKRTPVAS